MHFMLVHVQAKDTCVARNISTHARQSVPLRVPHRLTQIIITHNFQ